MKPFIKGRPEFNGAVQCVKKTPDNERDELIWPPLIHN